MLRKFDLPPPPRTPIIGYAISGGGYRSMLTGLGGLMGLMDLYPESEEAGTGGWFDALTYMAGLSGSAWGTGSFVANGGMLPLDLLTKIWNLESNLVWPTDHKITFYEQILAEVDSKRAAGFPIQLTDFWQGALSEHLLPPQYRLGAKENLTISMLPRAIPRLGNASLPFPIIIASQREQGEWVIAENATVWEFTPFSYGSWAFGAKKKGQGGFVLVEYLGTGFINSKVVGSCWKGFDQLGFIMGTSSTLSNAALLELNGTNWHSLIVKFVKDVLKDLGRDNLDVSRVPNPFRGWDAQPNLIKNLEYLTTVDAGETNQNIPLEPLLIPDRGVDAIIAFDASRDTIPYGWPSGKAVHTTFTRACILAKNRDTQIKMPRVPTPNGFINGKLNTRPVFFGCNDTTTPVIIYVPHQPWTYYSNQSTFRLDYDPRSSRSTMQDGLRSLTLNNTVPTWPRCLACALMDNAYNVHRGNRTAACQECFDTWCWDGKNNDTAPGVYEPKLGVPQWLIDQGLVDKKKVWVVEQEGTAGTARRVWDGDKLGLRGAGTGLAGLSDELVEKMGFEL